MASNDNGGLWLIGGWVVLIDCLVMVLGNNSGWSAMAMMIMSVGQVEKNNT